MEAIPGYEKLSPNEEKGEESNRVQNIEDFSSVQTISP